MADHRVSISLHYSDGIGPSSRAGIQLGGYRTEQLITVEATGTSKEKAITQALEKLDAELKRRK